jgi:GTP-binding protein
MQVNQAELVSMAVSPKQYPHDDLPEIALVGRSNVGKSSLINKLINRKNLARTSSKPGKTQTINFYKINGQFYFVDLPGYGYAKVSKKDRLRWGQFIEAYLSSRPQLKLVCHVVDIRHPPTENDLLMADWLDYQGLDRLVIATKADKLSKSRVKTQLKVLKDALQLSADEELLPFSSVSGTGREEIWSYLERYIDVTI